MILLGKNKIIKGTAAVLLITVLLTLLFTACSKKVDREASEDIPETYELTHGKSLKIGDYVQLGNYQVEDEGYNPVLWTVIDNSSHYSGYVNPEVEHITLLSACIIDLRGFDAIEPENANELRRGYGNGRYRTSNIRQWLNSSGGENSWWAAQNLDDGEIDTNNADKLPSDDGFPDFEDIGYEDKEGFLRSFTTDELESILDTTLTVGKNNAVDGGGNENVTDKIFLLSLTEVGLGDRSEYEEGIKFDFFSSDKSRLAQITIECTNNTKCLDKPPEEDNWSWWLRTPSPGFTASTFMVSSIGDALNTTANMCEGPVGLRPALNLKTDLFFKGSGTEDDPYIIAEDVDMDAEFETDILKEGEVIEDLDLKDHDEEMESYESGEVKIVIEEDMKLSDGDKLLQTVCLNAAGDYPEWIINSGSIVVWNGLDKNNDIFSMRQSPDYPSIGIQSPAEKISGGEVAALDFIDKNTIGYAVISQNGNGMGIIGLIQFEFAGTSADPGYSYHEIYAKEKIISIRDISFVNKNEFLLFYTWNNQQGKERAIVGYINVKSMEEEVLLEFDMMPSSNENKTYNIQKVSVSPEGRYAYIIYNPASKKQGTLAIFNLSNKKKIDEINNVSSAVWIGNNNILYSLSDKNGKAYLYDIEDNKGYEVNKIGRFAVDLSFCPKSGGVIIYNIDPFSYQAEAHALSCKNWEEPGNEKNCIFNAIVDEDTVICSKYAHDGSNTPADFTVWEGGYFSLKFKSGRHLSDEFSTNYQNAVLATVWSRY